MSAHWPLMKNELEADSKSLNSRGGANVPSRGKPCESGGSVRGSPGRFSRPETAPDCYAGADPGDISLTEKGSAC